MTARSENNAEELTSSHREGDQRAAFEINSYQQLSGSAGGVNISLSWPEWHGGGIMWLSTA